MKKHLRPDEVALALNCGVRQVYRLCAAGELRGFLIGRRRGLRITTESLDDFVSRRIREFEVENGGFCD